MHGGKFFVSRPRFCRLYEPATGQSVRFSPSPAPHQTVSTSLAPCPDPVSLRSAHDILDHERVSALGNSCLCITDRRPGLPILQLSWRVGMENGCGVIRGGGKDIGLVCTCVSLPCAVSPEVL